VVLLLGLERRRRQHVPLLLLLLLLRLLLLTTVLRAVSRPQRAGPPHPLRLPLTP
jgi:hypothetical protein